jgi:electron transport complex protein RnfE
MAKKQKTLSYEFIKGLWEQNSTLVQLLGLCPTLAVTVSAVNGMAMGLATSFVLVSSSFMIALVRNLIPGQVRIAGYIVIIAAFVTLADRFLAAYFPDISEALGPYIPLIVVNCVILGRAEAFASKNGPVRSIVDALGMGAGLSLVLIVLGGIREILGSGTVFTLQVMPLSFDPWMIMILPPGAFFALGFLIALANWINARRKSA